jgi:hypothetical protein
MLEIVFANLKRVFKKRLLGRCGATGLGFLKVGFTPLKVVDQTVKDGLMDDPQAA